MKSTTLFNHSHIALCKGSQTFLRKLLRWIWNSFHVQNLQTQASTHSEGVCCMYGWWLKNSLHIKYKIDIDGFRIMCFVMKRKLHEFEESISHFFLLRSICRHRRLGREQNQIKQKAGMKKKSILINSSKDEEKGHTKGLNYARWKKRYIKETVNTFKIHLQSITFLWGGLDLESWNFLIRKKCKIRNI